MFALKYIYIYVNVVDSNFNKHDIGLTIRNSPYIVYIYTQIEV